MHKLLLIITLLLSCSSKAHKESELPNNLSSLDEKAELYSNALKSHQDAHGFLTIGCDSLLFTSILATSHIHSIDVLAARDGEGTWHRLPDEKCFPEKSKSEISRDMLLGVMFWAVYNNQVEILEEMQRYGNAHDWRMGEGDPNRTTFTADLIEILDESIEFLHAGKVTKKYYFLSFPTRDYESHLQTLSILLIGKIRGKIQDNMFKTLQANAKRVPRNGLFQYAVAKFSDGNMQPAIDILSSELLFPSGRLPNTTDHCTEYLWQREDNGDWLPCDSTHDYSEHTGTDFLFLYGLVKHG